MAFDIDHHLAVFKRGAEELLVESELVRKLTRGAPLKIKEGFDPTRPDLHLGHTVQFNKLRQLQDLGHHIVFLIGDFTGMIGDPTGRNAARPPLSADEIAHNAKTYADQVFLILDRDKTEVAFNSKWLMALGTDRKFNLLVGRELQRHFGQEPQCILTLPLLEGLDGVNKMSKSLDNYVGITEPPAEMFGKLMSISDALMWRYYELLSFRSIEEIARLKAECEAGRNP